MSQGAYHPSATRTLTLLQCFADVHPGLINLKLDDAFDFKLLAAHEPVCLNPSFFQLRLRPHKPPTFQRIFFAVSLGRVPWDYSKSIDLSMM